LAYIDTPVERLDAIKDGEIQIWKVTHNGVDGHPVHFHMVNVQVINRVSWDGTVKPPEANEVGWKETLRMNPLEDVYVAVRAAHPITPFGVPASVRVLDPSQTVGSQLGFTQIDPTTGAAPTTQTTTMGTLAVTAYSNQLTNFDNEYVWHCHILGHEEQDFMRPFVFHPTVVVPDAPAGVTVTGPTVSWIDTTPFGGQDAQGVPTAGTNAAYPTPTSSTKNEIGYKIFVNGAATPYATVPANVTSWTDPAPVVGSTYTVVAYNAAGDSPVGTSAGTSAGGLVGTGTVTLPISTAAPALPVPTGPMGLTQTMNANGTVTLSWTAVPGATGYTVSITETPAGAAAPLAAVIVPVAATLTSYTTAVLNANSTYAFAVSAQTLNGTTAGSTAGLTNSPTVAPVSFNASTGIAGVGAITLNWANSPANVNNVSGLLLSWTDGTTAASKTFAATTTGATVINLTSGVAYTFTLQALSNVAAFSSAAIALPAAVTAP
jgi:hypothetical protein